MYDLKLSKLYVQEVLTHFKHRDPIILLYGSAVNGVTTSDLDVCTVLPNYDDNDIQLQKKITISFHEKYKLKLDDEIPFEKKLIYSFSDLDFVVHGSPFIIKDNKIFVSSITKNVEYLSSAEMRMRLLFNIILTNSIVLYGDNSIIEIYRQLAWTTLSKVIFSFLDNKPLGIFDLLEHLYKHPIDQTEGEFYLGFFRNNKIQAKHMVKMISITFDKLIADGFLLPVNDDKYVFDSNILRKFELNFEAFERRQSLEPKVKII